MIVDGREIKIRRAYAPSDLVQEYLNLDKWWEQYGGVFRALTEGRTAKIVKSVKHPGMVKVTNTFPKRGDKRIIEFWSTDCLEDIATQSIEVR